MIENNRYYWSHLKTKSVTVRVQKKRGMTGVVFRVGSMIDPGDGVRKTVMLDHVDCPCSVQMRRRGGDVAIPFRMGTFDFLYTSLRKPEICDVECLFSALYRDGGVERIVPEVLCPGDLLVFMQERGALKIKTVEALRVVEQHTSKKRAGRYAV